MAQFLGSTPFLLEEILNRRKEVGSKAPLRPIRFFVETRFHKHLKKALAEIPRLFRITTTMANEGVNRPMVGLTKLNQTLLTGIRGSLFAAENTSPLGRKKSVFLIAAHQ